MARNGRYGDTALARASAGFAARQGARATLRAILLTPPRELSPTQVAANGRRLQALAAAIGAPAVAELANAIVTEGVWRARGDGRPAPA